MNINLIDPDDGFDPVRAADLIGTVLGSMLAECPPEQRADFLAAVQFVVARLSQSPSPEGKPRKD